MLAVIIAGILTGCVSYITKIIIINKYSSAAYTLLWTIIGSIMFFPVVVYQTSMRLPQNILAWVCLVLAGLCSSLANRQTYTAFKKIDFSVYSIIFRLNIIFAVVLSATVFNDKLSVNKTIGIIVILAGVLVIFFNKRGFNSINSGYLNAIISALLVGISVIFSKYALDFLPISVVAFGNYFFQIPFVLSRKMFSEVIEIVKVSWKKVAMGGILIPLAWGTYTFALQNENISIVQPVGQAIQLITQIALGIIVLRERENLQRKISGFILNIVGIVLVCL